MCFPECFHVYTFLDNALFFGCIKTSAIYDGKLQPCSFRVAMTVSRLIFFVELSCLFKHFFAICEAIAAKVLKPRIQFTRCCGHIELYYVVVPLLDVRHFFLLINYIRKLRVEYKRKF